MQDYKVLLVGSSGSGKTTAISTVSETEVVNTDVFNTDYENLRKEMITVGLDYGEVTICGRQGGKLRLYGAPGQPRFSFIWKTLAAGAAGIVLLADNSLPDPLAELSYYLQCFKSLIADHNKVVVLGIVKTDISPLPDCEAYRKLLQTFDLHIPIIIVDAREYSSVNALILTLSMLLTEK